MILLVLIFTCGFVAGVFTAIILDDYYDEVEP